MTHFASALQILGRQLGLEDLRFDQGGLCRLQLGESFVDLQQNSSGDRLLLSSIIGELPDEKPQAILLALLESNSFFRRTKGGTIGIVPGTDAVVFCLDVTEWTAAPDGLLPALKRFVHAMDDIAALLSPSGAADKPTIEIGMMKV